MLFILVFLLACDKTLSVMKYSIVMVIFRYFWGILVGELLCDICCHSCQIKTQLVEYLENPMNVDEFTDLAKLVCRTDTVITWDVECYETQDESGTVTKSQSFTWTDNSNIDDNWPIFENSTKYTSLFFSLEFEPVDAIKAQQKETLDSVDHTRHESKQIANIRKIVEDFGKIQRSLVYNGTENQKLPFWMNKHFYFVLCVFYLNWPYKWSFYWYTNYSTLLIKKVLNVTKF